MLRLTLEKGWQRQKQGESHEVFLKIQLRNDGNLIVMEGGEKQFLDIFSV